MDGDTSKLKARIDQLETQLKALTHALTGGIQADVFYTKDALLTRMGYDSDNVWKTDWMKDPEFKFHVRIADSDKDKNPHILGQDFITWRKNRRDRGPKTDQGPDIEA